MVSYEGYHCPPRLESTSPPEFYLSTPSGVALRSSRVALHVLAWQGLFSFFFWQVLLNKKDSSPTQAEEHDCYLLCIWGALEKKKKI